MQDQSLMLLRDQVSGIILGTVFLFIGLAACAMAWLRGRGGVRLLTWFGIFSGIYGARILVQQPSFFSLLPHSIWFTRPFVVATLTYLVLIPALLFWTELSVGNLRRFSLLMAVAASMIAVAGISSDLITRTPFSFTAWNRALAIFVLLLLATVNSVPRLADKYLVIQSRISAIGTLILAVAALHSNLKDFLHLPEYPYLEPLAFAVFVLSLGYVAAQKVFTDGRRLLLIEDELAIAREIQNSILPAGVPQLAALRIHAAYHPMTAVGGDFYEFLPVDDSRAGFLVADVSGHGVPAALIAAMIKVATQSVLSCAHDPAEVLRRLNRILSSQLRGRLISAAYLWIDTQTHTARYSAAGHPPLLRWHGNKLERIESNGLLFGVLPDCNFPVAEIAIHPHDRFLLYTDGVIEPENIAGDPFGDNKLEEVIRANQSQTPSELSTNLLTELESWQSAPLATQDDITLVVIDVL